MSSFHRRPGETTEGQVAKDIGGPETDEFKDASLFDFDIDDDTPKPKHLDYLREVIRYMVRVLNRGSGRTLCRAPGRVCKPHGRGETQRTPFGNARAGGRGSTEDGARPETGFEAPRQLQS